MIDFVDPITLGIFFMLREEGIIIDSHLGKYIWLITKRNTWVWTPKEDSPFYMSD